MSGTRQNGPVSTSGGPGRKQRVGGAWRLRNWRLRTKLLAVLLIPTVAALVLGGLRVRGDLTNANDLAQLANEVQLEGSVADLVQQLQRERDLTVRFVAGGRSGDRVVLDRQIKRVQDAVDTFSGKINDLGDKLAPDVKTRFTQARDQLNRLSSLRSAVQGSYPADSVLRTYTESINNLLDLGEQAIATINEPDLVRLHLATNAVARAKEQESRKRALLLDVFQTGSFDPGEQRALLAADAELNAARNDFRKSATPDQAKIYDDKVTGLIVDSANNMEESALTRAQNNGSLEGLSPERWDIAATLTVNLTRDVESLLQEQLQDRTNQLAADARNSAIRDSATVLGALLLAVIMALFVARSLLNPLRVLRRTALAVADHELPQAVEKILADPNPQVAAENAVAPVPVHTREEVGQVARAFDAVHGEAVRLAAEQALLRDNVNAMFVNLSRRSQALVERQLNLIDRLEQDEQDPDQLASLFELDHLATRMRRNSENLLVLSGTDLGRRLTRPVPVSEVLGAAVSEVEQYARVQVAQTPDLTVQGRAVNDLVHLVAELLDNATAFSDPATKVTVRTAKTRAGELAVEIQDRGVGMLDSEIAETNERLADPPEVDVAVSRRMGLYVVARLAQRHDIKVKLRANQDIEGGTTALVIVPETLVRPAGAEPMTTPPPPAPMEPPVSPALRASSIAGAFTGTMSRVVVDDEPPVRFTQGAGEVDPGALPVFASAEPEPADEGPWAVAEPEPLEPQPEPEPADALYGAPTLFTAYEDRSADEPPGVETAQFMRPVDLLRANPDYQEPEDDGVEPAASGVLHDDQTSDDGAPKEVDHDVDAPTERLPIYEAVLSQWFQAVESETPPSAPLPVPPAPASSSEPAAEAGEVPGDVRNVEHEAGHRVVADEVPAEYAEPARPVTERVAEEPPPMVERPGQSPLPRRTPGKAPAIPRRDPVADPLAADPTASRPAMLPVAQAEPAPVEPGGSDIEDERAAAWQSPGDDGWLAARALLNPVVDSTTEAGLPKRVPKQHLVPGSAAPRPSQAPTQAQRPPLPPRSADAVRGRMSSLQQGVRRGRHALIEAYAGDQPSTSRQDEEQE